MTAAGRVCTSYGAAAAQSVAATGQDFNMDGGVGR